MDAAGKRRRGEGAADKGRGVIGEVGGRCDTGGPAAVGREKARVGEFGMELATFHGADCGRGAAPAGVAGVEKGPNRRLGDSMS